MVTVLGVGLAQEKAGVKAHYVVTNISGASVTGRAQEGLIPLARRGREITQRDINKAIATTKSISLSMERDLLYAIPQEFIVDDMHEVENPLGLFGTKLKARLYVVTAETAHVQNISKAISYAGYELLDMVPATIAAAASMLKDEDKTDGAIIIDVGGGITEMALICNGSLKYLESVNVGGMDFTARLSAHFKVPFRNAEIIKRNYGSISKEDLKKGQENIYEVDSKRIVLKSDIINNLLKERFEEIFQALHERFESSESSKLTIPKLIITGGSSLLSGVPESFEELFNIHSEVGYVSEVAGDPSLLANPVYSSAISLARYGLKKSPESTSRFLKGRLSAIDLFVKFKEMLDEYF